MMSENVKKMTDQFALLRKNQTQEVAPPRHNYSSLDKYDKNTISFKKSHQNLSLSKKNNGLIFSLPKADEKSERENEGKNANDWPSSNKRRYLQNYQLPKISSPLKRGMQEYETEKLNKEENQNLIEDEMQLYQKSKRSVTLETSPQNKIKLQPIKKNRAFTSMMRTKAGTNGKQAKINQDMPIIQTKLMHGLKLFCVCDGHGLNGHFVSSFIKINLIKNLTTSLKKFHNEPEHEKMQELIYNALNKTNDQLLQSQINTELAGSTVVAVFIYQDQIITFNVGDSRAILIRQQQTGICEESQNEKMPQLSFVQKKEKYDWIIKPLSIDQKPEREDERQRILKFGGRVFSQTNEQGQSLGPLRVWMKDVMMPGLAMTRSFGDKAGIKSGTNGEPQITHYDLTFEDKLIVVASDGIWEYLQNDDVLKIIMPHYLKDDLNGGAQALMKRAVDTWQNMNFSRDDITFIIVKLNEPNK